MSQGKRANLWTPLLVAPGLNRARHPQGTLHHCLPHLGRVLAALLPRPRLLLLLAQLHLLLPHWCLDHPSRGPPDLPAPPGQQLVVSNAAAKGWSLTAVPPLCTVPTLPCAWYAQFAPPLGPWPPGDTLITCPPPGAIDLDWPWVARLVTMRGWPPHRWGSPTVDWEYRQAYPDETPEGKLRGSLSSSSPSVRSEW